jgi:predicted HAD superfamily Cof-like phosphohydrolase
MKELLEKVNEFNKVFKVGDAPNEPSLISKEEYDLRFELMREENTEYSIACEDKSIIDIADALGDQLYILLGTINRHGLQDKIVDVFNEIHDSNMSKLQNGKVKKRSDGKILKGKNYFKPDLKKVLS